MALKYDAVLFDADDTLFDFERAQSHALEATFADHGLTLSVGSAIDLFREINTAVWREYEVGQSTTTVIRTKRFIQLCDRLTLHADPQSMSDCFIGHLAEADYLLDGAVELLELLRGRVTLVMVTNGLSGVQRPRFARANMDRYFKDIVISEEIGIQKPDARVFGIALSRAGNVAHDRAIMLGDNLQSDIKGALDAGLDACWVNLRGQANDDGVTPTFAVTALSEIPALLGL